MVKLKLFAVDAFCDKVFSGNPAGVCICDEPLDKLTMQRIASENNWSETAFLFKNKDDFDLRWFTPKSEIDLCGHATLASAFVLFFHSNFPKDFVLFNTQSGVLRVDKENDWLKMMFPCREGVPCKIPEGLEEALGAKVIETFLSRDLVVLLENEEAVACLKPNIEKLKNFQNIVGVCITAKGKACDFVTRFFAPNVGVNEDPVTGSAFSSLIPLWSKKLQKKDMTAFQLSERGGKVVCKQLDERTVEICGQAVLYLRGEICV